MLKQAADVLKNASRAVVMTGAGCSVEAGIPDFRSPSGWWRQIDPRTVATTEALEHRYELFHAFYAARIEQLREVRPHNGHSILSKWEHQGRLQLIATQNVDGLHQAAGNRNVQELHGSIRHFRCASCGRPGAEQAFLDRAPCTCGGRLRPDVVLFGEQLPEEAWHASLAAIRAADVVLVIGTSLQVYPVNQLPFLTDGTLILLNAEETGEDHRFDLVLHGRAAQLLQAMDEQ
ncbi:NAD-dependent deacylase [Paenibacillus sp. YYML68]|uniref:SIR2 family NAD-dependent protein deacylase n=1 Tax=Paenibacillus sp. YYML68 TaxID=2909250 RepID=UPI0024911724|nr:NAD-dependent deacylase [Paenibacillus sp. YYML68]